MSDEKTELTGFQKEIKNVQAAIADFESGKKLNIAIIAEPLAGRTSIANEIETINAQKVTRLNLSCPVKNREEVALPKQSKRIVIIDDCQFLYGRRIKGFDILEDFLKNVASSSNLFITTWNFYSWKYLDEVLDIGTYFPVQIALPGLTAGDIKECILSMYKKDEIKFVEDVESEKPAMVRAAKHPVNIKPFGTINIPLLKINYSAIKFRLKKEKKVAIEDIILEKIRDISNGNPGVAKALWHRSLEYPVIKHGKIKQFSFDIELDYNESFILGVILSMGSVKKEELAEITGREYQIDKILFRLAKSGLIAVGDNCCRIKPEALKSASEHLKKLRLVW